MRTTAGLDVPDAPLELPNMASTSALLHHWAVTDHPFVGRRPSTRAAARSLAVVLAIALTVAACGTTNPTRAPATAAPTPTIGTTPTIGMMPTPTPTSVPTRTIVPVPTSQLPAPASSPAAHLDARTAATLQTTLNAIRSKGHFPGMSAAVVFPDGSMWTGQSGVGVLSTGAPVTADTLFAVGSISKTFTGALALRLAERGTISLDDPVSRWVPTFPNAANITLRELLNHTSGIRDLFDPSVYKYIGADRSAKWTPEQVLSLIGKPYFAPGKGYHYSSTNYVLLGVVLERATGKTLASMIRSEFLVPLGLTHTFLQSEETVQGTFAHGYLAPLSSPKDVSVGQTMLPYVSVATASGASGGVVSTPSDIARWATALYDGEILDPAALASMTDVSQTLPYHARPPYGLAFEQLSVAGRLAWGHRGHVDGFWSTMAYLPDSQLTVVVCMNADWPNPLLSVGTIVTALLGPA